LRLYRYRHDGTARLAAQDGAHPVDLARAWRVFGEKEEEVPGVSSGDTGALIGAGRRWWSATAAVVRQARDAGVPRVDLDDRVMAPILPASLRDFLAFEDHVARGAARRRSPVPEYWYEAPVYYKGNHRAIIGPGTECPWPSYTRHLDFELELALIVGRPGRNVSRRDAPDHVFGFTILNDFSARDVQAKEMSAWLGPAKGKDFANALGPCIVTADEVGAEPDLEMVCRVNGEDWGRARSSDMHWKWSDIIAHVSASEDIVPGDVYGSGTPGGCCGLDLGRSLEPGDVVELDVEHIGVLRNTIGGPPGATGL
jgi:2-keto-4-pentenoate hydratase/2-oxohepta-3-ene-1,7-dioic acid hydratase in catechol pathway